MARTEPRPAPDREQVLKTVHQHCPACAGAGWRSRNAPSPICSTATTSSSRPRSPTTTGCAARLAQQGRVILALDGLQPDVGHEVLWVLRDCLSGEVLLARSLLSATSADLAVLLREVAAAIPRPISAASRSSFASQLCHSSFFSAHATGAMQAKAAARASRSPPCSSISPPA